MLCVKKWVVVFSCFFVVLVAHGAKSPDEIAKAFFELLKQEKVDEAYAFLVKGSILESRIDERAKLRTRTQDALDAYGPMDGYELVREEVVGTKLVRRTYVVCTRKLPLRWKLYFYYAGGTWSVIDLRVDDALVELFDEAGKRN